MSSACKHDGSIISMIQQVMSIWMMSQSTTPSHLSGVLRMITTPPCCKRHSRWRPDLTQAGLAFFCHPGAFATARLSPPPACAALALAASPMGFPRAVRCTYRPACVASPAESLSQGLRVVRPISARALV